MQAVSRLMKGVSWSGGDWSLIYRYWMDGWNLLQLRFIFFLLEGNVKRCNSLHQLFCTHKYSYIYIFFPFFFTWSSLFIYLSYTTYFKHFIVCTTYVLLYTLIIYFRSWLSLIFIKDSFYTVEIMSSGFV